MKVLPVDKVDYLIKKLKNDPPSYKRDRDVHELTNIRTKLKSGIGLTKKQKMIMEWVEHNVVADGEKEEFF